MVLGNFPVPGRPTIWMPVGQRPTALAVGAGGGCLVIFSLIYPISILSSSLWETARYRLKYCSKGPLSPKQTTNQSITSGADSPSPILFGGGSGGAKVLGKLPVPGRPTIWISVGQGPIVLAVGAGGGCLDIFTLIYPFSPLSPSLWETARYRLKYCLKGPLNQKTTNQPTPILLKALRFLHCLVQ